MWLLNNGKKPKNEPNVFRKMFTKTLWPYYLPIIIVALIIVFAQDSTLQFFINLLECIKLK